VHVHLLQVGDQAAEDYLLFRDHLRADASDRALYEDTKRELTSRQWPDMNAYADAKTDVIEAIKARAREQVGWSRTESTSRRGNSSGTLV
jgi:GrpB-like predicted nucleotidyltransferase (UPF0157 family)